MIYPTSYFSDLCFNALSSISSTTGSTHTESDIENSFHLSFSHTRGNDAQPDDTPLEFKNLTKLQPKNSLIGHLNINSPYLNINSPYLNINNPFKAGRN